MKPTTPLLALSLLLLPATAATVTFTSGLITAESDVNTQNQLVYAYDLGPTADTATRPYSTDNPVVNGVTFTTVSASPAATGSVGDGNITWTVSGGGFGNATPNYADTVTTDQLTPGYRSLLSDGFSIGSSTGATATLNFNNLTAGQTYYAQFFFNDSRSASNGRNTILTDGAVATSTITVARNRPTSDPAAVNDNLGSWVTAEFVADGTTQSYVLSGGNFVGVNAIQLRTVPEPSALILLMGPAVALLRRRR